MLKPNPYHNKGTIEFAIIGLNTYVANMPRNGNKWKWKCDSSGSYRKSKL